MSLDFVKHNGVFASNISGIIDDNTIRAFFNQFGLITEFNLQPDKFNENAKICYLKYASSESASKAVKMGDKCTHFGDALRVSFKKYVERNPGMLKPVAITNIQNIGRGRGLSVISPAYPSFINEEPDIKLENSSLSFIKHSSLFQGRVFTKMSKSINESIFHKLKMFAPLCLAETWDNVGILIEPEDEVKIRKIVLTNDLTINVMEEIKQERAQMIISYHPPLFHGFKKLRRDNWKEVIVSRCVKEGYYVYSPHTALDSVYGGVNDWLLSAFDVALKCPIVPYAGSLPHDFITEMGETITGQHGGGRYCTLNDSPTISKVIEVLKKHLRLDHLLLASSRHHTLETIVTSIAVCAGSGNSVLKSCTQAVDLWISGEMSHHELLDVTENMDHPCSVILTSGHSNSERGFLSDVFHPWLSKELESEGVEVFVSQADADPLTTV